MQKVIIQMYCITIICHFSQVSQKPSMWPTVLPFPTLSLQKTLSVNKPWLICSIIASSVVMFYCNCLDRFLLWSMIMPYVHHTWNSIPILLYLSSKALILQTVHLRVRWGTKYCRLICTIGLQNCCNFQIIYVKSDLERNMTNNFPIPTPQG